MSLTDTLGWLKGRAGGWPHPELEWFGCDVKARDARIAQVMPYFDGCNFAARAKCPVRIVAGLADWVCPPTAICAAYNRMKGTNKKLVLAYGGTHHSAGRVAVEQEKRERSLPVAQGAWSILRLPTSYGARYVMWRRCPLPLTREPEI